MPALSSQNDPSALVIHRGLHAQALLEANEERINALHNTLKLLEQERHELCGRLQSSVGLSATQISWLFRPAAPLPGRMDHAVGQIGNFC